MGAAWEVVVTSLEEVVVLVVVLVLDDEDGPGNAAEAGLECDCSPFM